jgi:hypothetical protein
VQGKREREREKACVFRKRKFKTGLRIMYAEERKK